MEELPLPFAFVHMSTQEIIQNVGGISIIATIYIYIYIASMFIYVHYEKPAKMAHHTEIFIRAIYSIYFLRIRQFTSQFVAEWSILLGVYAR